MCDIKHLFNEAPLFALIIKHEKLILSEAIEPRRFNN